MNGEYNKSIQKGINRNRHIGLLVDGRVLIVADFAAELKAVENLHFHIYFSSSVPFPQERLSTRIIIVFRCFKWKKIRTESVHFYHFFVGRN